jgi:hypothetical protein
MRRVSDETMLAALMEWTASAGGRAKWQVVVWQLDVQRAADPLGALEAGLR